MDTKEIARRKYKSVTVGENAGRFQIHLDGKPAQTPERRALETPRRALAEAVAGEWREQGASIDPNKMPLTRLLATEIDRVGPQRAGIIEGLANFLDTDVVCYRAAEPDALKQRQHETWQPVLDWLQGQFGLKLIFVEGVVPAVQPPATAAAFAGLLGKLDDGALTAFQACAAITNSLALSLALVHGRLTAAQTHAAANLDEIFQAEEWGEDALARERRDAVATDIAAVARYLELSRMA